MTFEKVYYLGRQLKWSLSAGAEFPYMSTVDGELWEIRVNDFPAEHMFTLLIEGREVLDFDDWPESWQRTQ